MTAKKKVLRVYPNAYAGTLGSATVNVVMREPGGKVLGAGQRESWAWAEA